MDFKVGWNYVIERTSVTTAWVGTSAQPFPLQCILGDVHMCDLFLRNLLGLNIMQDLMQYLLESFLICIINKKLRNLQIKVIKKLSVFPLA